MRRLALPHPAAAAAGNPRAAAALFTLAAMSVFVFVQEAPAGVRDSVLGSPITWAVVVLAVLAILAAVVGRSVVGSVNSGRK